MGQNRRRRRPAPCQRSDCKLGVGEWRAAKAAEISERIDLMRKLTALLGSLTWRAPEAAPVPCPSPEPAGVTALCETTELPRLAECSLSLHPAIRPPLQPGEPRLGGPHPLLPPG